MAVPRKYNVWKTLKAIIRKSFDGWIVTLLLPNVGVFKEYYCPTFEDAKTVIIVTQKIINSRKFPMKYLP